VGDLVAAEIQRAGFPSPKIVSPDSDEGVVRLLADDSDRVSPIPSRDDATDEDYGLRVEPHA
jgi:hypothetical protein